MLLDRPVIFTTFAGRRERMSLLIPYVRKAIASGLIDEWHVWDFARTQEDQDWLKEQFPQVTRLPDKLEYQRITLLRTNDSGHLSAEFSLKAKRDFHIKLKAKTQVGHDYEIVLGGWSNTHSCLRKLVTKNEEVEIIELARVSSHGVLSGKFAKSVAIEIDGTYLAVSVNGYKLFREKVELPDPEIEVFACTGFGSEGILDYSDAKHPKEKLFFSKSDVRPPFGEFYQFYEENYDVYKDSIFIKSDDDIVFLDLARLEDFIRYRIENEKYFLLSANVINNGVCAYYQQEELIIPKELMTLELPPGGLHGNLWQHAGWAENLHKYFLSAPEAFIGHDFKRVIIEWDQRLSINFISWLGTDLPEMTCHFADDEQSLSVEIPARLGRKNAIYAPFFVSHLSFYSQDHALDKVTILAGYNDYIVKNHLYDV